MTVQSDTNSYQINQNSKEGQIVDYISGQIVRDTPEEREAVQVFSRVLVEDYGYPKENIQTHPQR